MSVTGSPSEIKVGCVLEGRYRIEEFLGAGGMAAVFRALDEDLGRTVAIKVFHPGAAQGDEARQISETRVLASLNHAALVTLYDARLTSSGPAFLVMEYIDGGTLESRLRRESLSAEDAASLAVDIGEGLHVVHSAGIVHRDVKPSNILLRPSFPPRAFRATLADFGIAHLIDSTRVTAPGAAVGTPAYIAPEQVRGADPTPASDIYALGLVLLEALTGRRAFAQQTPVEAIAARLSTPPHVPSDFGFGWRALLAAMTSIDPDQRPTALEVATRAGELDTHGADPSVTTPSMLEQTEAESSIPDVPHVATRVFPSETDSSSVAGAPSTRPRRPRGLLLRSVVGLTAVVAGVIGVTAAMVASSSPEDAPPALPQVEEPLDTHLRHLLDVVTR